MNNKMKYGIGAMIVIGISPLMVALYFAASTNYIGIPGCNLVAPKEKCINRERHVIMPQMLAIRIGRIGLCLIGHLASKWGGELLCRL